MNKVNEDMLSLSDISREYKVSLNTIYYHISKKHFDPIRRKGDTSLYVKKEQVDKIFKKKKGKYSKSNKESNNVKKSK